MNTRLLQSRWLKLLAESAAVAAILALGMSTIVLTTGETWITDTAHAPHVEAIIVPGAAMYASGRPSDIFADRLKTAAELYKMGLAPQVIISHAQSTQGTFETDAAVRFAEKQGIPAEALIPDYSGWDTASTMRAATNTFHLKTAIIATQSYHLPRALFLARTMGIEAYGVPADKSPYRDILLFRLREVPARIKAFIDGCTALVVL